MSVEVVGRESWSSKADFLFSTVGFAVDLANVWRFPYLCFKNGGGVFLIPYVLMVVFAGLPMFFLELSLGQYFKAGPITTWARVNPYFKGIGYCVVLISIYTSVWYVMVIAWSLYYAVSAAVGASASWVSCGNSWNSDICFELAFNHSGRVCQPPRNRTAGMSAAEEFFLKRVLGLFTPGEPATMAGTFTRPGGLQWELVACLAAVQLILYFCMWKGIKTSGKVWIDAATQVFFSLGAGIGALLTLASYNKFENNLFFDAIFTTTINCLSSFVSGFVIFITLGYMSCKSGVPIKDIATEGPSLVFVVYPEALATLPLRTLWEILFFIMLFALGIDSVFGGVEVIFTALEDEYPILRRRRELFVGAFFLLDFALQLIICTKAGVLILEYLSFYASFWSLLVVVFLELIAVSWVYGVGRISSNIEEMIGHRPGLYWKICWFAVAPAFVMYNVVSVFVDYKPMESFGYVFPGWANALGFAIGCSSIALVPLYAAVYAVYCTSRKSSTVRNSRVIPLSVKPLDVSFANSNGQASTHF